MTECWRLNSDIIMVIAANTISIIIANNMLIEWKSFK